MYNEMVPSVNPVLLDILCGYPGKLFKPGLYLVIYEHKQIFPETSLVGEKASEKADLEPQHMTKLES